MRLHRGIVATLLFGYLAQACSSGDAPSSPRAGEENLGTTTQAITVACSEATLGLPCDPDGPAKPATECEGLCWFGTSGLITCTAVKAGKLDGISCGTQAGVGNGACTHYCSGKTCLNAPAPAGSACRPTSAGGICAGQCDGAGHCGAVAEPCATGRDEQLCTVNFCDQKDASKCTVINLAKSTRCSDANACSISSCNGLGACVAGGTAGCDDGNACTDDTCDPNSGACLGEFNDANGCSDSNACTSGDFCQTGVCHSGAAKPNCDDGKLCTTDSCDPNTGCANVPIACGDNNACTTDSCDPNTGGCVHGKVDCDDQNPCTVDDCAAVGGCSHTPLNCDDNNLCTADSCTAGVCGHAAVSCADADACTEDTCVAATGCAHAPISGCGVGGAGGTAGNAGTGATAGTGGNAGTGGTAETGGNAGTGGTDTTDGGAGGAVDPGGAGQPSTAGSSSAGTAATGGDAPTGQAGTSATGGTEASTAGTESGGSTGATAGSTNSAGDTTTDPNAGGQDGTSVPSRVVSDSGCSCRVPAAPRRESGTWMLAALGALAAVRRRRSQRA